MTLPLTSVITLLIGHWVGDYVLQTNKIAKEKSKSFAWLLVHVGLYTSVMAVCSIIIFPRELWLNFIVINGLAHLVTDFITSRINSKFHSNQRVYYLVLGFDQMTHGLTLLSSAYLLSGSM